MHQAIRGMVLLCSCSLIGCVVGEPAAEGVDDPASMMDEAIEAPALVAMDGQPDLVIAPTDGDDAHTFLTIASTTSTTTTTTNLLPDGGFETAGDWTYLTGAARTTSTSYKGSWSLTTIGQGGNTVIARQRVRAKPGMLYSLSFYQKVLNPAASGQFGSMIGFDFRDVDGHRIAWGGGMGYVDTDGYTATNGWAWGRINLRKAPQGTAYVRVFFYSPDPTDATEKSAWDSLRLEGEMCMATWTKCTSGSSSAADSCFKCCSGSHPEGDLYFCN